MHVRHAGGPVRLPCMINGAIWQYNRQTITRLTFTAADGTEFELRDQLTGGQVILNTSCASPNGYNRGRFFSTVDGTSATFVSDADIIDIRHFGSSTHNQVSGYLMLKDGTRYRVDGGTVTSVRDRNGNTLTYDGTTITDSLNRTVTIAYNVNEGGQYGTCDKLTYKGFGGTPRVIRVCKSSLGNALRSDYTLQAPSYLFPELEGSTYGNFNPTVVSAVWLPDGDGVTRHYEIRYNSYGEVAWVKLPTGGVIEYDHAGGLDGSPYNGGVIDNGGSIKAIYRRVVERRERADGVNLSRRTTYSRPETYPSCCAASTTGYVTVEEFDGSNNRLAYRRNYFHGAGAANSFLVFNGLTSTAASTAGREYRTEAYAANGTTELRRVQHTWQTGGTFGKGPFVSETVTTLVDANLVAKQTYAYDQYNNQTDVYDYGYGAGVPGAFVRRTHTDYLTTHPVNGANYATNNDIHVRSLPAQVWLSSDAAGLNKVGLTAFEYDNYSSGNYAPLTARSNISGHDAGFGTSYATRGNAVKVTKYADAAGQTGAVSAYTQYDVAGNVVKAIDARGYATTIDFADRFGSPNGEARANSQPSELGSQAAYAFATSSTNALGHTGYTQYDYHLGRPVEAEDVNGVVYAGFYNDALDRPTQLVSAYGLTSAQAQTTFSYNDTARTVTTTSDRAAYGDNLLKSESLYDQMGRTFETRQYESSLNYSAVRRAYDSLGRANQLSNPFRPWQGESPVWTTTGFDALGRTTNVTSPDGGQVLTAYSGNQVTVTDQAGKSRRSVTDALGRMAEVVEDPAGLAYATSYTYDVQGNLRQVDQGSQQRFFMYDSLSRLTRVKLPEQAANTALALPDPVTNNGQWSASYTYDAGGNVLAKTDARGITVNYVYDVLSRNTSADYSDTTAINPDVKRHYDNATPGSYGKGRFYYDCKGGDCGALTDLDHRAVDAYDALGRPLVVRQHFKPGGVWSPAYQTSQSYDRAGNVLTVTYPSGRTVNHTGFDGAGRLQSVTGNLGDGVTRTYSSGIEYDSAGRLRQEQFGTQTPLYHKLAYNVRGQLYDVRLSTHSQQAAPWNWNRGALVNHYSQNDINAATDEERALSGPENNGSVKLSQHWVPGNDQITTSNWMNQWYDYDALNRLSYVKEQANGGGYTGEQHYTYDRFGNRTINAGDTYGTGVPDPQFAIDAATNRVGVPGGQGGAMAYDNAGNLTVDTYSANAAGREYDAEGRMTMEQNSGSSIFYRYAYDADGRRTRRDLAGEVTHQIYGLGGELLAEYPAGGAAAQPRKEYGYRGGELLVTAQAHDPQQLSAFIKDFYQAVLNRQPSGAELQSQFNALGAASHQGPSAFFDAATLMGRTLFQSQEYANRGRSDHWFVYDLYAAFLGRESDAGGWAAWEGAVGSCGRACVLDAFSGAGNGEWAGRAAKQANLVDWLVSDHLGTPRMVADKTGSLAGIRRHDYLPFGEELLAGAGGRLTGQGYAAPGVGCGRKST